MPAKKMYDSTASDLLTGLKRVGSAVTSAVTEAVTTVGVRGNIYLEQSDTGKKAKALGAQATDLAGKTIDGVSTAVNKIGANLSGEEAQARIAALVEQQRRYNDILATRLAEALDRIENLEAQVARLSRGR